MGDDPEYSPDEHTGYRNEYERDTESYLAEAKHYYDEAMDILTGDAFGRDDEQHALSRSQDYIGWLLSYVNELQWQVSDLISDRDYNSL